MRFPLHLREIWLAVTPSARCVIMASLPQGLSTPLATPGPRHVRAVELALGAGVAPDDFWIAMSQDGAAQKKP